MRERNENIGAILFLLTLILLAMLFGASAVWTGISVVSYIVLALAIFALISAGSYFIFAKAIPNLISGFPKFVQYVFRGWLYYLTLPYFAPIESRRAIQEQRSRGENVSALSAGTILFFDFIVAVMLWFFLGVVPLLLIFAFLSEAVRHKGLLER